MKNLIQQTAIRTIEVEASAVQRLKEHINSDFEKAVLCILQAKGRLIVTGIGKSAIIGQKIVATLNSTGTPALFMHAADAIHGDSGMILPSDVVLCLSKSGETPEIKVLIPFIKNLKNPIIAIVAAPQSYLAQQANFVLLTPVDEEADPNNLAPTTSTTVQIVMGDALATALLAMKGFSAADFAKFHPGGTLGKQLYLQVSDLYPKNEKPSVLPTATIRQVIMEMTSKRLGAAVVTDEKGEILGVITDGDLRRMLSEDKPVSHLLAKNIMTTMPKRIAPNALAIDALDLMRKHSITQLIVAEGDTYLGMVHLHDLVREGLV